MPPPSMSVLQVLANESACCHHEPSYRIIPVNTMSDSTPSSSDPIHAMREEFRAHLETFYAQLQLAPPYESVEKAIRTLTTSLHALPKPEQARIAADTTLRWDQFRLAFDASGLSKKHRGIIAGLARHRANLNLPAEYDRFLSLFAS
jgi:hypothetical protein